MRNFKVKLIKVALSHLHQVTWGVKLEQATGLQDEDAVSVEYCVQPMSDCQSCAFRKSAPYRRLHTKRLLAHDRASQYPGAAD